MLCSFHVMTGRRVLSDGQLVEFADSIEAATAARELARTLTQMRPEPGGKVVVSNEAGHVITIVDLDATKLRDRLSA